MKELLLVEDTDTDAELMLRTLRLVGVANPVRRISSGSEAMAFLSYLEQMDDSESVPAVLLLDLKLPGLTGFEILQRIQGRPAFSKTLCVVLSQLDDTKSIKQAYTLGADSFLVKPVGEFDLRELVRAFPAYWAFGDATTEATVFQPRT